MEGRISTSADLSWVRTLPFRQDRRLPGLVIRRIRGIRFNYALALAMLLCSLIAAPQAPSEERLRRATASVALDVVRWEIEEIAARSGRMLAAVTGGQAAVSEADRQVARSYLAARDDASRAVHGPAMESALERAMAAVLQREGVRSPLPLLPVHGVFPPVSLSINNLPKLAVVSPRHQIKVARSVLLKPETDWARAERLERAIDDSDQVSLVVPIGGLSTYPAMLPASADERVLTETAAHEWVHAYLFFTPLGQRYWSDYRARTMNETAADIAGREIGRLALAELGIPWPVPQRDVQTRPAQFDFRAEMRATRVEVERLLAAGRVSEAEAYMRQRQDVFAKHGYPIRRLNQAYFAFFGSYAESGAAGFSPLPGQLRRLRQASSSLGDFLRRVGQLTIADQLATAPGGEAYR
jgi:hypothetical protein